LLPKAFVANEHAVCPEKGHVLAREMFAPEVGIREFSGQSMVAAIDTALPTVG
jgi:hypothetical protein